MSVQGRCLCEKIQYEFNGNPCDVAYCHCSECRRTLGAAFAAYARIDSSKFEWKSGTELLSTYESSPTVNGYFCSKCGSQLGVVVGEGINLNWISLGTVDGDPGVQPEAHIFVGSKATWHEITDDLPQFEEWPPNSSAFFQRFS